MKNVKRIISLAMCILLMTILCIPAFALNTPSGCLYCQSPNISANTSGCLYVPWRYINSSTCGETWYQALMHCNSCGENWLSNYTNYYYHCYFTNPQGKQECLLCGNIIN